MLSGLSHQWLSPKHCASQQRNRYFLHEKYATPDMRTYSEFVLDRLRRIPRVKDINSNFVMRLIKSAGGLADLAAAAAAPK
jgi:DNA-binding Lrp family transcriptional regulator